MTNSCPEASNVRPLDKYNLELIGKAWLWDRLQPLTPLQPSPPRHTPWGILCPLQTGSQSLPKGRIRRDPLSPWQPPYGADTHAAVASPVRTRSCRALPTSALSPSVPHRSRCSPKYRVGFNSLCAGRWPGRWRRIPAQRSTPGARRACKGIAHGIHVRAVCPMGAEMPAGL